jgi:hypothetical protein
MQNSSGAPPTGNVNRVFPGETNLGRANEPRAALANQRTTAAEERFIGV